jgi:hypothetical protein
MANFVSQTDPAILGISAVDLTDTAGTQYASNVVDVGASFLYTAIIDTTITGAVTVGAFKLTVDVVGNDGSTSLYSIDLVTALDSNSATNTSVVTFGAGAGATILGSGTLDPAADVVKVAKHIKLTLEITTASDAATSAVASVTLLAQK